MTETVETPAVDAIVAPAKPVIVRAPKLVFKLADGTTGSLLKYPFPAKAAKYSVKINGAVVDAASTAGKGKHYTYLLINNTSFYVPGLLPVDAEVSVDFPENYKFDDSIAARVSTYKPKTKRAPAAEAPAAEAPAAEAPAADEVRASDVETKERTTKATRRGR